MKMGIHARKEEKSIKKIKIWTYLRSAIETIWSIIDEFSPLGATSASFHVSDLKAIRLDGFVTRYVSVM